jgi:hypothetical protein
MEATATLLPSGQVLVAGGHNGTSLASAELYNPATGLFTPTGSLHTARRGHAAVLLPDGQVLIIGGDNGHALASVERYNPVSGTFTETGFLATARACGTATLLTSGRVLVTGGRGGACLASAELYDPTTGQFIPAGSLAIPRANHTATLRLDGKVLLAGGEATDGTPIQPANTELFDPATGSFRTLGPMATARTHHRENQLDNGKILLTGGFNGVCLGSAELR